MKKSKKVEVEDLFIPKARFSILEALSKEEILSMPSLARITKRTQKTLQEHLKFFVEIGVVEEVKLDDIKGYRLKVEDEKILTIKMVFEEWEKWEKSL